MHTNKHTHYTAQTQTQTHMHTHAHTHINTKVQPSANKLIDLHMCLPIIPPISNVVDKADAWNVLKQ